MRLRLVSLYGDLRHVPPLAGMRRFGVPPGGPMDAESVALAAALVGSPVEAVVELAFGEATFAVEEPGVLALVGAGRAERIAVSGLLTLAPVEGARLALAAPGGWIRPELGADPEASLALRHGDVLAARAEVPMSPLRLHAPPESLRTESLCVVPGPQRDLWTGGEEFAVAPLLDRRGVRLFGAPRHDHEIASEPCVPGVVQWTPGGDLILLGPDGPTIGGYPKPFVVIAADLPKVGQLVPGREVGLVEVGFEEARALNREAEARLSGRLAMIRLASGKLSG